MKVYIKNMVCNRCKMVVKSELEQLGLQPLAVELGEVELKEALTTEEKKRIDTRFRELGFELIDDKKSRLIERVKNLVIELVHHSDETLKMNVSDYLMQFIPMEYKYLSNLFSEVEGTTIEKFYIAQRIERVKELLVYDELSLSEIADQMGYSSVAYLSTQFKKVVGLTPSHFKSIRAAKRKSLDLL
ncbi:AraC family transcriptional regulator [Fluviicola chungangensis]|uniref:Helix-turn-helix transcriptional regulator n=1 Tax=Fluviicola chungangensis TaxID=2597671 RepID=A0A556MMZ9_9FLAO|nr:AraC family transcriptional regulator [Fluviicola chungangensis]TSJ41314.1 helix-turn-helix transcriptional regulator [Fluviicola chungangensis]